MPDENEEVDEQDQNDSSVMRELRSKAKDSDKYASEAATLRTEVALLKADLGPLTDKQRQAVLATHDGDLTPDALRLTASELGFVAKLESTEQVPADEQAALGRVAQATGAGEPADAHVTTLSDEIRKGNSPDEVIAILEREGLLTHD